MTLQQAFDEEFFLGLRQLEGIDLSAIEKNYDREFSARLQAVRASIEKLRKEGLVETAGTRVRLAPGRLAVSNEVFVELLGG
jgi:oxygen-independent coproporphyrinogen-3 oxidase